MEARWVLKSNHEFITCICGKAMGTYNVTGQEHIAEILRDR